VQYPVRDVRLFRMRAPDRRATVTVLAVVTLGLGLLALLAPVSRAEFPAARVGSLLALAAGIEVVHALRRSTAAARRQATIGAVISMAMALFLINAPFVAANALRLLVAGWFAVDAIRYAIAIFRSRDRTERQIAALAALGNAIAMVLLLLIHGRGMAWGIATAGSLRIVGIAWNIMVACTTTAVRPWRALWRGTKLTMVFKDGSISGTAGCNTFQGKYTRQDNRLMIGPVAATRKFCAAEGVMDQEGASSP
jgi:uncharacterized membrane protein HdeD (DUF308 family)